MGNEIALFQKLCIVFFLRTGLATLLPLRTTDGVEIGTAAGEGPTVVQGPDDRDLVALDIVEQRRVMQVITMDVVQVDDIGLKGACQMLISLL